MMTNLAFMLSNWYSGATLLAILLNNHSKLVCNGETFPFQYDKTNRAIYICSCGKHMLECNFYVATAQSLKNSDGSWTDAFRVMPNIAKSEFVNKIVCSFNRHVWLRNLLLTSGLPLRVRLNSYLHSHQQFYGKSRGYYGAACYIDGTKSIRRAELFVQYGQQQVKVIYLIRDGRAFCWSYLKNKQLSTSHLEEAAAAWLEYIDLVDIFSRRYPRVILKTIRYEDLCSKLAETLQNICQFLNIDFEQTMIGKPTEHHMLGNRMRSSFDGTVKEDLSWKHNFSQHDREKLEELLRPNLERYAYL